MKINLQTAQKEIHKTAVEKGWWCKGDRNFGEICSLFHSEISEAFDEYMKFGRFRLNEIYYNNDKPNKPEGFVVELLDFVIRYLDWSEYNKLQSGSTIKSLYNIEKIRKADYRDDLLCIHLHKDISDAFELYRNGGTKFEICKSLNKACLRIFKWAENYHNPIDIYNILEIKMEYNKSRDYRHGNKKA